MRYKPSYVLLLFLPLFSLAQSRQKPPPPGHDPPDNKCYNNGKLTPQERLKNYPFNVASEILLVSFDEDADGKKKYGSNIITENYTPVFRDTLYENKLHEKKQLSEAGVDSLSDILYNYSWKNSVYRTVEESGCYQPRNAIVFIDKEGRAFAFIEVCFECSAYKTSDAKILAGDFCEGKYELLRNFFKKEGIKTGVVK
jgi:hypothetical protein